MSLIRPTTANPTVTVVIPCFNEAQTILRCLDAWVMQTRPVDRIVVVCNGTTDDTATLVRTLPHVRLLELPTGDKGAALNAAITTYISDLWIICDGDTVPQRDLAQTVVAMFHEGIDGGGFRTRALDGSLFKGWLFWTFYNVLQRYKNCHNGLMWYTDAIMDANRFDEGLAIGQGEDTRFHNLAKSQGFTLRWTSRTSARTSMRRFEAEGYWTVLKHWERDFFTSRSRAYGG